MLLVPTTVVRLVSALAHESCSLCCRYPSNGSWFGPPPPPLGLGKETNRRVQNYTESWLD